MGGLRAGEPTHELALGIDDEGRRIRGDHPAELLRNRPREKLPIARDFGLQFIGGHLRPRLGRRRIFPEGVKGQWKGNRFARLGTPLVKFLAAAVAPNAEKNDARRRIFFREFFPLRRDLGCGSSARAPETKHRDLVRRVIAKLRRLTRDRLHGKIRDHFTGLELGEIFAERHGDLRRRGRGGSGLRPATG